MLKSVMSKVAAGALAAMVAVGVFVISPATSAHAQDGTDLQEGRNARLEFAYASLQLWSENMGNRLDFTPEIYDVLDRWIALLEENGRDASELRQAKADFESAIASAQAEYDQGAAIVAAGNGFDANGDVTDPEAARETVSEARQYFADARQISVDAFQELRDVVEDARDELQTEFDR